MTIDLERAAPQPPPEKPEAEASLLGSLLLDGSLYGTIVDAHISPSDLSRDAHRLVLGSIARVAARGEAVDYRAVQADLEANEELAAVGGAQFLVGLMQNVPSVMHAETYATIVERTGVLRRLIRAANDIAHVALTRDTAETAVREAQATLFGVSETLMHRDLVSLDVAMTRFVEQLASRVEGEKTGVPTGLATLDARTGGLQPSDLILLAGRPGLGKTSLALNMVSHAALREGKTCAVFSMEMSELQVVQRLVSLNAEIDGNRMRRGRLGVPELQAINAASSLLQTAPIYIEESSRLTVTDILAKARRLQSERGLDLLVIDYLQLIEGADDGDNRVLEVAKVSRSLKAIARELQVPVIACSQLSRQIETRGTEPMLSDLRESGALEADADIVMFLWQKDQNDRRDKIVRLKLAKHRNGPTAEIDLHFEAEYTRFRDLGETQGEA
jgi:replicative DNA helicase